MESGMLWTDLTCQEWKVKITLTTGRSNTGMKKAVKAKPRNLDRLTTIVSTRQWWRIRLRERNTSPPVGRKCPNSRKVVGSSGQGLWRESSNGRILEGTRRHDFYQHRSNPWCALGQGARVHGSDWRRHFRILPCGWRWGSLHWSWKDIHGHEWAWKLNKQLYGRRPAPRKFSDKVADDLCGKLGLKRCKEALHLYYHESKQVAIEVDVGDFYAWPRKCSVGSHDSAEGAPESDTWRSILSRWHFCPPEEEGCDHWGWSLDYAQWFALEEAPRVDWSELEFHWKRDSTDQRLDGWKRWKRAVSWGDHAL